MDGDLWHDRALAAGDNFFAMGGDYLLAMWTVIPKTNGGVER